MKTSELRAKNKDELKELLLSLKKEQFNLRFQQSTGALENALRFRSVRKTIARAKTLLNETPKAEKAVKAAKAPAKKKTVKAKKEE